MLKKLISKLGYVPKSECDLVETTLLDKATKHIKSLHEKIAYLENSNRQKSLENIKLKNSIVSLTNELKVFKDKSRVKGRDLKESRRKQTVLLKKNRKLKDEIDILNISKTTLEKSLNQANKKTIWLEAYNSTILHKLEQICFGSTLPRAMKQSNLDYYLYPKKRIKYLMQNYLNTCTLHAITEE